MDVSRSGAKFSDREWRNREQHPAGAQGGNVA
jgi:hypothetical protein